MKEEIREWLEQNPVELDLESFDLKEIRSGESNYNCIIERGERKYVLRISRKVSRENRLETEKNALKFLENKDISNVPKIVQLLENTKYSPALLETFVGKHDLDAEDFSKERLESLAETLAKIHSIPLTNYNSFFDKDENEETSLKEVYRKDFEEWSKEPFEEYLELVDEPDERLVKHFERQKELVESVPDIEVERSFIHGDLGFNVRSEGDKVFIVDWEYARVGYPEHDILYFFEHEGLNQGQRDHFIKSYRKHRDLGEDFEKTREIYAKFLAFNDAIWAANRVEKEPERIESHREVLEDRIEKLETL